MFTRQLHLASPGSQLPTRFDFARRTTTQLVMHLLTEIADAAIIWLAEDPPERRASIAFSVVPGHQPSNVTDQPSIFFILPSFSFFIFSFFLFSFHFSFFHVFFLFFSFFILSSFHCYFSFFHVFFFVLIFCSCFHFSCFLNSLIYLFH